MSREVGISALNTDTLSLDGKAVFRTNITYTKEWVEKLIEQNPEAGEYLSGRLIIGCSSEAHKWIMRAVREGQANGFDIIVTDEEDIFAPPGCLLEDVIFPYWREWHDHDPRWDWGKRSIRQFFDLYMWALIYIDVY